MKCPVVEMGYVGDINASGVKTTKVKSHGERSEWQGRKWDDSFRKLGRDPN